jgi:hypothetical protein
MIVGKDDPGGIVPSGLVSMGSSLVSFLKSVISC